MSPAASARAGRKSPGARVGSLLRPLVLNIASLLVLDMFSWIYDAKLPSRLGSLGYPTLCPQLQERHLECTVRSDAICVAQHQSYSCNGEGTDSAGLFIEYVILIADL